MALTHNPSIVTSGLVMAFDAASAKSYQENLITHSQGFTNTWNGSVGWILQNITATSTNNIAPDGTSTASLFTTTAAGYTPIYQPSTATITAGSTLTASIYFKAGTSSTLGITVGNSGLTNNFYIGVSNITTTPTISATAATGTGTYISSSLTNVGNGWYRASVTGVIDSSTTAPRVDFPIATGFSGVNIYLWGAQLNYGTGAAPYVVTTSSVISNTWLDLTGTYRGTVSNTISYSSANSGSIVFTSSANANVATQNSTISLVNGGTLEMWVNLSSNSIYQGLVAITKPPRYINFFLLNNDIMRWEPIKTGVSTYDIYSTTVFRTNTWYHVVGTFNSTSCYLYVNSVLESSNTSYQSSPMDSISAPFVIGTYSGVGGQNYASASIPMVRFYNRALTADEVLQNYNAHRGRYGI